MSAVAPIKIRYGYQNSYPGSWTAQGVGAQSALYKRGWYPQLPTCNGKIMAFCRVKKWLYFGGDFTTVNGAAHVRLARMNLEDGAVDSTFTPSLNNTVLCLATDGDYLYVGGDFTTVNGASRSYAARINSLGTLDTTWTPAANAGVYSIAIKTGTTNVYLGGNFSVAGGSARLSMAEINNAGVATAFVSNTNGTVYSVAYNLAQNRVYAVGSFATVNGTARANAFSSDGDTGVENAWDPSPDGTTYAVAVNYPLIYIGGEFTNAGGSARTYLACINQAGTATTFNPGGLADILVSLAVDTEGRVFFGGVGYIKGAAADGSYLPWTVGPAGGANICSTIYIYKSTVFCGGDFTQVNSIGSTTITVAGGASIPFPLFRNDNTIFVKSDGLFEEAGAGTYADPKRTMAGALGTTPTFNDQSAAGNNLTQTGTVHKQWESWTKPSKGYWMAGLFDDSNYLNIPSGVGTAIAASNAFTAQFDIWLESLAAINTIWDYQDAAAETVVSVATTGALNFNLRGTTATSAAGVIQARKWYTVTVEKNPSGNLKRAWVGLTGQVPRLVINTTQVAVMGAHTSNRLAKDRSNASRYLVGFMGPVFFFDAAMASTVGIPVNWRDSYDADCIGYYPMQTKCALEGDVDLRYVCVLDSATYEEAFNWHVDGTSLYTADGCAPTFAPRIGAKPGTYGARKSGREKFSTGAGSTFIYVSKAGNDATGTRGNATLPFLTIQGALGASGITANDTIQIQDSGVYVEKITAGVAVILQAAQGEVPTLRQYDPTAAMIIGAVSVYGLVLSADAASVSSIYTPTAAVELWDCTLSSPVSVGLYLNVAGATFVFRNNAWPRGTVTLNDGSISMENSQVFGFGESGVGSASTSFLQRNNITSCNLAGNLTSKRTVLATCSLGTCTFGTGDSGSTYPLLSLVFFRCSFTQYQDGQTLFFGGIANAVSSAVNLTIVFFAGCIFKGDGYSSGIAVSLTIGNHTVTNVYAGMKDCSFVGVVNAATAIVVNSCSAAAMNQKFLSNAMNCPGTLIGFNFSAVAGSYQNSGLVGSGATTDIQAAGALTVSFSTFSVVGANVTGSSLLEQDPVMLSEVAGVENVALSATSPGIFLGDSFGTIDQGANWAWICNQIPDAILNGFIVEGSINLGAGLENTEGMETFCEFLTFSGLGLAGLLGREGINAYACDGAECNGMAFRMGGASASATYCKAWSCSGAAFVWGAPDFESLHNSSWGCEFGEYDAALSVGETSDSIHSDNGVDVVANEAIDYSDVGTLEVDAVVGTGTIRKNPLYQDPYNGNLALQTLAAGFPKDSPAKGTAEDGSDMGAYDAEYGPLLVGYTELDFAQISSVDGKPWRNPDDMPREIIPIKPSEGEKPLGGSYSTAKAYKQQWTLFWDPGANPMQMDQLIALNEVYQDNGIVSLALDGSTFIDCVVLKSNTSKDDQIDQKYSNTDMPRPLESLVLREV